MWKLTVTWNVNYGIQSGGGATNTSIVPNTGTMAIGGNSLSRIVGSILRPSAGGLILAGQAATVTNNGTPPTAPTFASKLLEGVSSQGQSIYSGGPPASNDFAPTSGFSAYNLLGFKLGTAGTGGAITSIKVYRTTNQAQAPGSFPFYDSILVSDAATAYANFVSNATTAPASGADAPPFSGSSYHCNSVCDHAYPDTVATGCIVYPAGSGTDQYLGTGYCYEFTCVDASGNESARSAPTILPYIVDGNLAMAANVFNGTLTPNSTTSGTTPLGYAHSVLWTIAGSDFVINPYAGGGTRQWGAQIRPYNYLYVSVCPQQAWTNDLEMEFETVHDVFIEFPAGTTYQPAMSSYGPSSLSSGTWYTFKLPLYGSGGVGVYSDATRGDQHSYYKGTLVKPTQSGTAGIEMYFSVN